MSPRRPNRRADPGSGAGQWWIAGAIGVGLVVLLGVWGAARVTGGETVGNNPPAAVIHLVTGKQPWPAGATLLLVGVLLAVAALGAVAAGWWWSTTGRSRTWVDRKAASMATGRELAPLTERRAAADAAALYAADAGVGVPLARSTRTGAMLYSSWQYVQLWIMGPRAGKTSCAVVPMVCSTAGPVYTTSNKRDVVDLTRAVRETVGRVWVFDPQHIAGAEPTWWWNPLSYVTSIATATKMASLWASSATESGSQGDAYFEPEGAALLAQYVYAAALSGDPVTIVWTWLNDPDNAEPAQWLDEVGETELGASVRATTALPDKQKAGVYGTARKMCRFLTDRDVLLWVTPQSAQDPRPMLDPAAFARSTDTIYSLSKEGAGTARGLTGGLTLAIADAAEAQAESTAAGRMVPPLMMPLDEAANIVRWRELPDLLSHYGSKGIIVAVFLQSYSQGAEVWGDKGMSKIWSACNVRVVGSGVAEPTFLRDVSGLIGDHDVASSSVTVGGGTTGSRSRQLSNRREAILEPAELTALPTSRAVAFVSGIPAAMITLRHWSTYPFAERISASASRPTAQAARDRMLATAPDRRNP